MTEYLQTTLKETREQNLSERGKTVTVIEIFDTEAPADSITGLRPLKGRFRQTSTNHRRGTESELKAETGRRQTARALTLENDSIYYGGYLDEVTVTADKKTGLWQRLKDGILISLVILLTVAVLKTVYKFRNH